VQVGLNISPDGKAGPETWTAIFNAVVVGNNGRHISKDVLASVDPRSEQVISSLNVNVQPYARALVQVARTAGITIKVISGMRTYAEQDALYAKGRQADGPIVTRARGGYSNHNFGIAFDIGVFENAKYLGESPKYKAVGVIGMQLGLEWGGNWKTLVDEPHFQLRPEWAKDIPERGMLAGLRERVNDGRDLYA
jgi:peptidoglycan L-alanyl-D-glutamate endopeptidase CwlK